MKYRNRIPEPGTTISGFADNKKKSKKNPDRPTLDFLFNIFLVSNLLTLKLHDEASSRIVSFALN
jgi:hypothetical protein